MANPTSGWDRVPVYGWFRKLSGASDPGQIRLSITQRVTRVDGRVIYAGGDAVFGDIGSAEMQDPEVRSVIRQAMRDADQAAQGAEFDGTAWDVEWDANLPSAVFLSFPASDDPDVAPHGWKVKVEEKLASGAGKTYFVEPLLAHLDLDVPGINLGLIEVPPGAPSAPAPIYAKGQPGGVAALDADGDVLNAAGEKVGTGTAAGTVTSVNEVAPDEGGNVALGPDDIGALPVPTGTATASTFARGDGTWATPPDTNTTYSEISQANLLNGSSTATGLVSGRRMAAALGTVAGVSSDADNLLTAGTDGKAHLPDTVLSGYLKTADLVDALSSALGFDVVKFLKAIDVVEEWGDDPDSALPDGGIVLSKTPEP